MLSPNHLPSNFSIPHTDVKGNFFVREVWGGEDAGGTLGSRGGRLYRWMWWGWGGQISFKNAAEEKSLEVSFTAKMMPFMLARSPFHLPLLPEERGVGG